MIQKEKEQLLQKDWRPRFVQNLCAERRLL